MARQSTPLSAVRRWVSEAARQQFRQAQDHLRQLDVETTQGGTSSHSEWREQETRVPKLKEQEERLTEQVELAERAVKGFAHELHREAQREVERHRDRGMEYER